MLDNGKIGIRQLAILVTLTTVGDSILILPNFPTDLAKQDAWASVVLAVAVGLLLVYLMSGIGKLKVGLSLFELSERIFGKWLGIAVSILYLFYFLLISVGEVREIGDFMTTHLMPETPNEALTILFIGITLYGVRLGIESIARSGELMFPWFVLIFVLFTIFLLPQVKMDHIKPVMENGIKPVLQGALTSVSFPFAELAVFMMIIPFVKRQDKVLRGFMTGALLGGIVLLIVMLLSILVLGADVAARNLYPSYTMAQRISIGKFLERLEVLVAAMWFITAFIKLSLYFYAFSIGLGSMLRLREYRVVTLPTAIIFIVMSIAIAPNITYYNDVASHYWPFMDLTFSLLVPLLLLGMYAIRKKSLSK